MQFFLLFFVSFTSNATHRRNASYCLADKFDNSQPEHRTVALIKILNCAAIWRIFAFISRISLIEWGTTRWWFGCWPSIKLEEFGDWNYCCCSGRSLGQLRGICGPAFVSNFSGAVMSHAFACNFGWNNVDDCTVQHHCPGRGNQNSARLKANTDKERQERKSGVRGGIKLPSSLECHEFNYLLITAASVRVVTQE